MKAMKTICLLSALVIAMLLAQNASALPNSSMDDWEGNKTYDEVYVEWAVYTMAENPWASDVTFSAGNNYIYAYQIGNLGADPIESFYLLETFGGTKIDWITRAVDTQAVADGDGIMPILPSEYEAQWNWSPVDGDGFITTNGYSAFLIFSSPYAPVAGGFKVERSTDEGESPIPDDIPEPGSIALLGIASSWLIANRRRKQRTA
jgi:hypothetical protein